MIEEERMMKLEKKVEDLTKKKERLGVRIVVEFTGHMSKDEIQQFNLALSSVLDRHMENGGGGT